MSTVQNTEYMGHELKLGWGKSVPNLGSQPPIYVPERLKWLLSPPKPSNLPLNAQPPPRGKNDFDIENLHQCTGDYDLQKSSKMHRKSQKFQKKIKISSEIFKIS